jgi:hypothetical protein
MDVIMYSATPRLVEFEPEKTSLLPKRPLQQHVSPADVTLAAAAAGSID